MSTPRPQMPLTQAEAQNIAARELTQLPPPRRSPAEFPFDRDTWDKLEVMAEMYAPPEPDPRLPRRQLRKMDIRWLTIGTPHGYQGKVPPPLAVALAHCPDTRRRFLGPDVPPTEGHFLDLHGPLFRFLPTDEERAIIRADILREGREAKLKAMTKKERKKYLDRHAKRAARRAEKSREDKPNITKAMKERLKFDDMLLDRGDEIIIEAHDLHNLQARVFDSLGAPPAVDTPADEFNLYSARDRYGHFLNKVTNSRHAELTHLLEILDIKGCRKRREVLGDFKGKEAWNARLDRFESVPKAPVAPLDYEDELGAQARFASSGESSQGGPNSRKRQARTQGGVDTSQPPTLAEMQLALDKAQKQVEKEMMEKDKRLKAMWEAESLKALEGVTREVVDEVLEEVLTQMEEANTAILEGVVEKVKDRMKTFFG